MTKAICYLGTQVAKEDLLAKLTRHFVAVLLDGDGWEVEELRGVLGPNGQSCVMREGVGGDTKDGGGDG